MRSAGFSPIMKVAARVFDSIFFAGWLWAKILRLIFTVSTEIRSSSGSARKFGAPSGIAGGSAERRQTGARDPRRACKNSASALTILSAPKARPLRHHRGNGITDRVSRRCGRHTRTPALDRVRGGRVRAEQAYCKPAQSAMCGLLYLPSDSWPFNSSAASMPKWSVRFCQILHHRDGMRRKPTGTGVRGLLSLPPGPISQTRVVGFSDRRAARMQPNLSGCFPPGWSAGYRLAASVPLWSGRKGRYDRPCGSDFLRCCKDGGTRAFNYHVGPAARTWAREWSGLEIAESPPLKTMTQGSVTRPPAP